MIGTGWIMDKSGLDRRWLAWRGCIRGVVPRVVAFCFVIVVKHWIASTSSGSTYKQDKMGKTGIRTVCKVDFDTPAAEQPYLHVSGWLCSI